MVENDKLLHFVPRSLQLSMSKNNNTNVKPRNESLNLFANDSKKRRTEEKDAHSIEEDHPYKKVKKIKRIAYDEVSQDCNMLSARFYQLEDLIAEFLSSRGLSNTLSSFLSETQHEFARKAQKVKLEDLYQCYCNRICSSPTKENSAEGKVNREITLGNENMDVHTSEEISKKKDNKVKYCMNYNERVAKPFIKTPNGFSKAKAHASEIDFQRSKKRKSSVSEVLNVLSGVEDQKITEKVNKKLEPVIITQKNSVKLSNASNELEQVFDFAEPLSKSKKSKRVKNKEATSEELNMIDNDKQNGGKKSKKATIPVEEVQPMKRDASHTQPKKGKSVDLTQDLENPISIEVFKKEKKKKKKDKKTKSNATSLGDNGELGDASLVIKMPLRNSGVTDSNNANKESKVESLEDLSVEPSTSPNFKVTMKKRKKLSQTALANNKKKNKKVKKVQEELQVTFSHTTKGGTKGDNEILFEDTGNTQNISMACQNFERKRSSIRESLALKNISTDTTSQNRGRPGKQFGAVETEKHISPETKKEKQKEMEMGNMDPPQGTGRDVPLTPSLAKRKAIMTADQMRYEIRKTIIDDNACSADPIFMVTQIMNKYCKEILTLVLEQNKIEEAEALKDELIRRVNCMKDFLTTVRRGQHGEGCSAQPSSHDEVWMPPSITTQILPTAFSATRSPTTDTYSTDTTIETSTSEAQLFPLSTRVTSTGSFGGSLLLNTTNMFPLKVPKLPGNDVFYETLFEMTLKLFGPTIRKRWNEQNAELKNQLVKSLEDLFGNNIFDNGLILKKASKHIKIVRDQYRRALKDNPKYERPPMIPPMEWNEIMEDAKEKRLKSKGIQPEDNKDNQITNWKGQYSTCLA